MIALHPVGIGDLLESATGSFASGGPVFGGQLPTITDGLAVPTPGPFYASNGSQVEYILGSTIDLARIDFFTYADWQRTSIWVDVEVSTDGGSNWTLLHEVRVAESNGGSVDRDYNAASLTHTSGTLAAGINAIRFTFLGDGMGGDESGYAEIDVYGGGSGGFPFAVERSGNDLHLRWDSKAGRLYNLRSEVDPSNGEPVTWPLFGGHENIEATPPENTLTIPLPADTERFFVIEEFPAPPESVYSDDFEGGQGAWTTGSDGVAGTTWEFGSPTVVGPAAANSGANCFGTNLSANYAYDADVWLRSPLINLTTAAGATLNFSQYVDIEESFDFGQIRLLDSDAANAELAILEMTIDGNAPTDWKPFSKALPAAALGKNVVIEFRFDSDDFLNQAGWYIDDVNVTVP